VWCGTECDADEDQNLGPIMPSSMNSGTDPITMSLKQNFYTFLEVASIPVIDNNRD